MATLQTKAIDELRQILRGKLITPVDPEYDEARKLYNGMIDKRPGLIAQVVDVADVLTAVRFAREHDLLVAVRGGGHNGPGLGSCNDGLLIDLSAMKGVRVDPAARTVRVGSGCTQGDADHASHAFGLHVPAGIVSTTGIAGLTLGGGHGYLSRKHGLTIDNLLEADVVLPDGRFVTASAKQNEDLFWGLRGGGGNFGIVTSFLYQAHPVDTVYGWPMFWDVKDARQVMEWYREFLPKASRDTFAFFGLKTIPSVAPFPQELHGRKVCAVIWCYSGPMEKAEEALKPVKTLPPPILELVGPMPFTALQTLFDPLLPSGMQWYWKGDFVKQLTNDAINVHLEHAAKAPSELSLMHLYPIDGAVHDVASDATPWSYRDVTWSMVIAGIDPDPAGATRITDWAKGYWDAIHPHSAGGAYVNFMMEEGSERVQATYQNNYNRLVQVKKSYDPTNFLRVNQNIKP